MLLKSIEIAYIRLEKISSYILELMKMTEIGNGPRLLYLEYSQSTGDL